MFSGKVMMGKGSSSWLSMSSRGVRDENISTIGAGARCIMTFVSCRSIHVPSKHDHRDCEIAQQ